MIIKNTDYVLNVPYELVLVKRGEMRDKIIKSLGLNPVQLSTFTNSIGDDLFSYLYKIKTIQAGNRKTFYEHILGNELDAPFKNKPVKLGILLNGLKEEAQDIPMSGQEVVEIGPSVAELKDFLKEEYDKNDINLFKKDMGISVTELEKCKYMVRKIIVGQKLLNSFQMDNVLLAKMGNEVMPVVVSAEGYNLEDKNIQLLDGFYRLLYMNYTEEELDQEILVKVYDKLDDRQWINAMVCYNSWKFARDNSSRSYLDRGFRLGLYNRYKFNFLDYTFPRVTLWDIIDIYCDLGRWSDKCGEVYETIYDNEQFINDLKFIHYIFNFNYKIKNKGEELSFRDREDLHMGAEVFLKKLTWLMGYIRRNRDKKTELLVEWVDEFLALESAHIYKMLSMKVEGHISNFYYDKLSKNLEKFIFEKMNI